MSMSTALEAVLDKLEGLSLEELLFLQEKIIEQVHHRVLTKPTPLTEESEDLPVIDLGSEPAEVSLLREDIYD